MADVTLKQGIEHEIKQAVPTIKAVLDVTDHAGGTNPYYQPGKSGAAILKLMVGVRAARLIPARSSRAHDRRPEASAKRVVVAMGRVELFQHRKWSPRTRAADGSLRR